MSCYFTIGAMKKGETNFNKNFFTIVYYSRSSELFSYLTDQFTAYDSLTKFDKQIDLSEIQAGMNKLKNEIDLLKKMDGDKFTCVDDAFYVRDVLNENIETLDDMRSGYCELALINRLIEMPDENFDLYYYVG